MELGLVSRSWRLASGRVDAVSARPEVTLHALLRLGCALCFVGHGAWGVITKAGWLPFYGVFGIPASVAWKTMPVIGAVDVTLGLIVLLLPFRALLVYLVFWTVFTALLRPAAGLGWWEFLERGGNYGPPLALLLIAGEQTHRWFQRVEPRPLSPKTLRHVAWVLRGSIALLLVGHGGFELFQQKKMLLEQWRAVGIPASGLFLRVLGAAEIGLGLWALARPSRGLLLVIAYWKIASELLYPITGRLRDTWEWVERAGDYVAPFALIVVLLLLTQAAAAEPSRQGSPGA
jgi:hypothetical protein